MIANMAKDHLKTKMELKLWESGLMISDYELILRDDSISSQRYASQIVFFYFSISYGFCSDQ